MSTSYTLLNNNNKSCGTTVIYLPWW